MVAFEIEMFLILAICLSLSFIFGQLFRHFNQPTMLSPLLLGLFLNADFLKTYIQQLPHFELILSMMANMGLIMLLFYLGLKINFKFMKNLSKESSIIALTSSLFPLILGFFTSIAFGFPIIIALFIGICLSLTAEEVSISVLNEMKLAKRKIGQMIIEIGLIGDIFEIIGIAILGIFLRSVSTNKATPIFEIASQFTIFIVIIILLRYFIIPKFINMLGKNPRDYELFLCCFIILLIMSAISELLQFGALIGALMAGLILKDKLLEDKDYNSGIRIKNVTETVAFGLFEPMVFIWLGYSMNISQWLKEPAFGIMITVCAILGKLIGTILGSKLSKKRIEEGYTIGWGLNSRGGTELFAILLAKSQHLITDKVYSAIIFMALATTLISPIIFKSLLKKKYNINTT